MRKSMEICRIGLDERMNRLLFLFRIGVKAFVEKVGLRAGRMRFPNFLAIVIFYRLCSFLAIPTFFFLSFFLCLFF